MTHPIRAEPREPHYIELKVTDIEVYFEIRSEQE